MLLLLLLWSPALHPYLRFITDLQVYAGKVVRVVWQIRRAVSAEAALSGSCLSVTSLIAALEGLQDDINPGANEGLLSSYYVS